MPRQLLRVLRDLAPDDVIITTDVGSHKIFTALNWPARQPNRYFVSNGLSAMGFGLTSAIAAALITGQSTVCITGDAGLAMVIGELGLLQELSLPVIVMVMKRLGAGSHSLGRSTGANAPLMARNSLILISR